MPSHAITCHHHGLLPNLIHVYLVGDGLWRGVDRPPYGGEGGDSEERPLWRLLGKGVEGGGYPCSHSISIAEVKLN